MRWQDAIFSTGSVIFSVALLPTLRGPTKPALASSVLTASLLYLYGVVYVSLHLWFSFITGFITATCWSILAIQRHRQLQMRSQDRTRVHVEDSV